MVAHPSRIASLPLGIEADQPFKFLPSLRRELGAGYRDYITAMLGGLFVLGDNCDP